MRSFFIILTFIIFSKFSFGQSDSIIISGTVIDGETNFPLSNVHLYSKNGMATKTNEEGVFELIVNENDSLKITHIGYKTLTYDIPHVTPGKYLTKFVLLKDSISLAEVEILPWPTYEEFKKVFEELNFKDQEIKMEGVRLYKDRNVEPFEFKTIHIITNPLSLLYDKL